MIFTAYASTALKLAAALRARGGVAAWAYVSNGMSPAERETSRREWAASETGVIVATSALGTGMSTPRVGLVLMFEFSADPIDLFQKLGRPARELAQDGVGLRLQVRRAHA